MELEVGYGWGLGGLICIFSFKKSSRFSVF